MVDQTRPEKGGGDAPRAAIRPRGDIDGLIAATAIVHDLILVTRNEQDFMDTGASVINPWDLA